jgi:hypothetical protein
MTRITVNHIKLLAMESPGALGYSYVYAPNTRWQYA